MTVTLYPKAYHSTLVAMQETVTQKQTPGLLQGRQLERLHPVIYSPSGSSRIRGLGRKQQQIARALEGG